jgi:phage tail-like protein
MSDLITPTYLLLDSQQGRTAPEGWQVESSEKLQITANGLQLALQPSPPIPLKDNQGTFGGLADPTGVAIDSQGNIYIADGDQHRILRLTRRDGFQVWATFFRISQGPFASDRFVYVPTAHRLERWRPSRQVAPQSFDEVEVISITVWDEIQAQKLVLEYVHSHQPEPVSQGCSPVVIDRDLCQESIAESISAAYPSHLPAGEICKSSLEYLPCLGGLGSQPRQFNKPRGLAISGRDWLYVADSLNHRVQIFALPSLTLIDVWGTPVASMVLGAFHEPWDVVVDSQDNVYIADKGNQRLQKFEAKSRRFIAIDGSQLRARVWQVRYGGQKDDRFVYIPARQRLEIWVASLDRDPINAGEVRVIATGVKSIAAAQQQVLKSINALGSTDILLAWDMVYPLETDLVFVSPTHLAIDGNNWVYVVDEAQAAVRVLDDLGRVVTQITYVDEFGGELPPTAITVAADGKLILANSSGLHRFDLRMDGLYEGCCGTWSGHCHSLATGSDDLIAVGGDLIAAQVPNSQRFEGEGVYFSQRLDSEIDRCPWHKIQLHCEPFPLATTLQIWTYTSDDVELTATDIRSLPEDNWLTGQINGSDFLVLSPPGRFVWLKMKLAGNGDASPILRDLEVHFPRQSYLQYLPAVYQSDPVSKDFLERFLSIFQTVLGGVEDKIDHISEYFDPDGAPNRLFLEWLAGWLDMTFYEDWSLETCRRLLRHAPELYRQRGTPAGLKQLLWLALGIQVEILEHFRLRQWLILDSQSAGLSGRLNLWGNALFHDAFLAENAQLGAFPLLGEETSIEEGFAGYAHRFSVYVPAVQCRSPTIERQIRALIEAEKPAHTQYFLHKVEPRFRVGVQSTVGMDMLVGDYPQPVLNHCATLGYDTVLNSTKEANNVPAIQVGRDRLGVNTNLS